MYSLIDFAVKGDERGNLVALEIGHNVPFDIKRVYYVWNSSSDAVRGGHSHVALEQLVVCTSGSCDFILTDGITKEVVHLNSPAQGLYLKNNIWREFTNFSDDCVVMVLASEYYTESDYIRDYATFLQKTTLH